MVRSFIFPAGITTFVMTILTTKQLENFKELYLKHFNIKLNEVETLEKAITLLTLTKAILLPNAKKV